MTMATTKHAVLRSTIATTEQSNDDDVEEEMQERVQTSPVAARKEHFENIFKKPALSLTNPKEFKHYAPGSLVKERHSWLREVTGVSKFPEQPVEEQAHSPPLRCYSEKQNTPTAQRDDDRRDEENKDYGESTRDLVSESPMKDFETAIPVAGTFQEEEQRGDKEYDEGDDKILRMETLHHTLQQRQDRCSSKKAQNTNSSIPVKEIAIASCSDNSDETRDDALNISDLQTDERGEDLAIIEFRQKRKQEAAARKQDAQGEEKLRVKPKSPRPKIRMVESEDQQIAVENLMTTLSSEVAELHKQQALTVAHSGSNEYDEWQVVRVNSQTCETKCLDSFACMIM
jgi:hypothetical protein